MRGDVIRIRVRAVMLMTGTRMGLGRHGLGLALAPVPLRHFSLSALWIVVLLGDDVLRHETRAAVADPVGKLPEERDGADDRE